MSKDRTQTDWLDVIAAIYLEVYGTDLDIDIEMELYTSDDPDLKEIISSKKINNLN